ncbi:Uma2 family endonuclease [Moorena sp. SIO1F2]|uniref:Uma2 family endonuclease n=1 Tax=Moorena sp. SIO1F2 TaxID=2607819 RepID=UPI0025DCB08C|nr:Uma2 family endonuclease [Moorena sp. SIO1F2]
MTISTLPLTIPPLENGDTLTRFEFEQRYAAMPEIKKAELIERCVYMTPAVHAKAHGKPHAHIMGWLVAYEAVTTGVEVLNNSTVGLDADNEVQPDALLRIEENGQSTISNDDYVEGAPELIVEIAASSASYDLHQKFNVYRRNQVQEYLVWRVYDQELDWFCLQEGKYIALQPDQSGILTSTIFPGLCLAKSALLSGDLGTVLGVLQEGVGNREQGTGNRE